MTWVVIVDDEHTLKQNGLVSNCASEGYQVVQIDTFETAAGEIRDMVAQGRKIKGILLDARDRNAQTLAGIDITLPELKAHDSTRDIRVVVYSAYFPTPADKQRALDQGAYRVVDLSTASPKKIVAFLNDPA